MITTLTTNQTSRRDRTIFIINSLPGTYSEKDFWVMPDGNALRTLADMLGEGSQAFLFLDQSFGDPKDYKHDYIWHEHFDAEIRTAWQGVTPPRIFVENGFTFKFHGGEIDDVETSEELFGTQTGQPDYLGRHVLPTPIRIYGGDYWNDPPSSFYTRALCKAVLAELSEKAITFDGPVDHCDARMNVWLQRAGATSEVYQSLVHIADWSNGSPVIDSEFNLIPV